MKDEIKLPYEWLEEGKAFLNSGNLKDAKSAFEKALELDPYYPQAMSGLSKVLWMEGKHRESVEMINKALEIDADDSEVIEQCANIFIQLGRKNDALDVLDAYIARNPWDDDIKRLRDEIHSREISVASGVSFDASRVRSKEADFLVMEGENQLSRGKVDRARMCFEMALEHDPNHPKALNNLGVLFWNDGELLKALEYFQKAFHESPDDKDIVFNSFHALVAGGYFDGAKEVMKFHIQKNPFNDEAWELYDEAVILGSRIGINPGELSPEVSNIYVEMAEKLSEAGDLWGCVEALHRALAINPRHSRVLLNLARIHRRLGNHEESINFYKEALEVIEDKEEVFSELSSYLKELGREGEENNFS